MSSAKHDPNDSVPTAFPLMPNMDAPKLQKEATQVHEDR